MNDESLLDGNLAYFFGDCVPQLQKTDSLPSSSSTRPGSNSHQITKLNLSDFPGKNLNFANLVFPALLQLVISRTQQLSSIDQSMNGSCFPNLRFLDVSGNQLRQLDVALPNLECLNVADNLLAELPDTLFQQSPSLVELHIDRNQIQSLPESMSLVSLCHFTCDGCPLQYPAPSIIEAGPSAVCSYLRRVKAARATAVAFMAYHRHCTLNRTEEPLSPLAMLGDNAIKLIAENLVHDAMNPASSDDSIDAAIASLACLRL